MNAIHRRFCRSEGWRKRLSEDLIPWALTDVDMGQNLLEVGPGLGLTTDLLKPQFQSVTSIEIDPSLASALRDRMKGTNVTVVEGDATRMPFSAESFSGAVCFTMLHHVPSVELQDRLLAEVGRVLRPGASFAGTDSRISLMFRLFHVWDTMVVVDPATFGDRLSRAGFTDISITVAERAFRFKAKRAL